jgi:hypothetical protein
MSARGSGQCSSDVAWNRTESQDENEEEALLSDQRGKSSIVLVRGFESTDQGACSALAKTVYGG